MKPHTALEIEENIKYINLDSAELEEHQRTEVEQIFQQYHKMLSSKASQLGQLSYVYDIDLPQNANPIKMALYRIDLCDRDAMRTEINKLLEADIIEKSMSK